jgi:hypothetical protein
MKFKSASFTLTVRNRRFGCAVSSFRLPYSKRGWQQHPPTAPGMHTYCTLVPLSSTLLSVGKRQRRKKHSLRPDAKGDTGRIHRFMFPGGMRPSASTTIGPILRTRTLAAPKTTALCQAPARQRPRPKVEASRGTKGRTVVSPNGSVGVVVAHRPIRRICSQ